MVLSCVKRQFLLLNFRFWLTSELVQIEWCYREIVSTEGFLEALSLSLMSFESTFCSVICLCMALNNGQCAHGHLPSSLSWFNFNFPIKMRHPVNIWPRPTCDFQLSVWNTGPACLPFPSCRISRVSRALPARPRLATDLPPEVLNPHSWPSSADGWQGSQPGVRPAEKPQSWIVCSRHPPLPPERMSSSLDKKLGGGGHVEGERRMRGG